MAGIMRGHSSDLRVKNRSNLKKRIFSAICLTLLIFLAAVIQTSSIIRIFGSVPAMTFSLVCAIGFIRGGRAGAAAGIFAGALTDCLGGIGVSFSPIFYMLCGYLCGAAVGWFLSTNLLSFIVYSAIAGLVREGATVIYFSLFSESFSLWEIFKEVLISEYFAYILCVIPAYFAVFGINLLFKGKKDFRA